MYHSATCPLITKESGCLPKSSDEEVEQQHVGDHDMQAKQNGDDIAAVLGRTVRCVIAVMLGVVSGSTLVFLWKTN